MSKKSNDTHTTTQTNLDCTISQEKNPKDLQNPSNAQVPKTDAKVGLVNEAFETCIEKRDDNYSLTEQVDITALKRLLEHPDIERDDQRTLRRYLALLSSDGSKKVTYRPSEHGIGRIYAEHGLSLQFFPKRIRHTLAKDLLYDIDMVNAHPVLLLQLCNEKGWCAPQLTRYVEDREIILQEIMSSCHVSRKQAKELLLRLMYGGTVKYWKLDERVPESTRPPPFIAQFEDELKILQQKIWLEFPKIQQVAKKPKAMEKFGSIWSNCQTKSKSAMMGSCMSLVLQEREHRVMLAMTKFFQLHDWVVSVYVFDGIMVKKSPQKQLTRALLQQCEDFVQNETGLEVKLEEKPMDDAYDLDFQLPLWELEYARRLLDGISTPMDEKDPQTCKWWEQVCIACKAIGMSFDHFWNWMKQKASTSEEQCKDLWQNPTIQTTNSGWQVLEQQSKYLDTHATRPILDLQCPYGIDDLLQVKTIDRIKFLAPKVLALITGEETGAWYKKVILNDKDKSAVRFVRMSDKLKSLSDIYIDIVETSTVQRNGQLQQKETSHRITLDTVIKKFVLSENPSRMSFSKVDFYPYSGRFGQTGQGVFNTFAGFPFRPCQDPTKLDFDLIQPFLDGMKEVLCNNEDALFVALCDFYTDILRHPERKSRICPVLYSPEQQVGKGFFTLTLGAVLVGDELLVQVANDELIVGKFNSTIEDKLMIVVDDPDSYGASYKLMGRLKNLISEPKLQIHRKGCEAYTKRSCIRCMYCTNTLDAVSIEVFDKRFFVTQCNASKVGQMEYFEQLSQLASDYDYILWNYFYHRKLSSTNWKNTLPVSAVKRQILRKKFPMPIQFVISDGELWKGQDLKGCPDQKEPSIRWHYEALYQQYRLWSIHEGIDSKYIGKNWTSLEEPLKSLGIQPIEDNKGRLTIQKKRLKGFQVSREQLLDSVRAFLKKSGQEDADEFAPPDIEHGDEDEINGESDMIQEFPDVFGDVHQPICVRRI